MKKCARFGWAIGALAVTILTDYAKPADEDQLWGIWKGNARVTLIIKTITQKNI